MPPPGGVQWLRPSVFAKGDQTVLFVGDVPGDGPMVAGQVLLSGHTYGSSHGNNTEIDVLRNSSLLFF